MPPAFQHPRSANSEGQSPIHCEACQSAFRSGSRQAVSFLLLDHLTVPALGCDDHLEQFASVCGLTSEDTADLLQHRPAGGIRCPGCRLAPHSTAHPMLSVREGAVTPMACPDHQAEIVQRFQTGLRTRQQLSADIGTSGYSNY
ncbi:hypothetical protein RBH26_20400 [Natronolimnohabitans sp. A-GB9]|uniref:hypothetical protein n=1 Tax=Natronolimnohabitans sp. A-GB9 TaxID=3069757 RepID=UPI0027B632A1|nr:hypothetical protein [Natronolimnohabitans sp. A-GB9]MDQ2052805.1 hypothetical protein [Natronolimnohabitans sp. A-GB9]